MVKGIKAIRPKSHKSVLRERLRQFHFAVIDHHTKYPEVDKIYHTVLYRTYKASIPYNYGGLIQRIALYTSTIFIKTRVIPPGHIIPVDTYRVVGRYEDCKLALTLAQVLVKSLTLRRAWDQKNYTRLKTNERRRLSKVKGVKKYTMDSRTYAANNELKSLKYFKAFFNELLRDTELIFELADFNRKNKLRYLRNNFYKNSKAWKRLITY